ncbi:hypothetical protein P171DRAFT_179793 [Karstenula rhodostoma CBS 690.94]|uniref:Uncharacterized protein n=1 Tax=Karstenula rhodostoma CBS 690.94 TaxID=1392251 RepID=A0A9P4P5C3_9PLEO|nr:hypothetical protein P171DRAFT_179793 [Karstenula rhodostoma CBS 690.94]
MAVECWDSQGDDNPRIMIPCDLPHQSPQHSLLLAGALSTGTYGRLPTFFHPTFFHDPGIPTCCVESGGSLAACDVCSLLALRRASRASIRAAIRLLHVGIPESWKTIGGCPRVPIKRGCPLRGRPRGGSVGVISRVTVALGLLSPQPSLTPALISAMFCFLRVRSLA